ncbi:unnamed protein product, partial [Amoebophrya sp. A120]
TNPASTAAVDNLPWSQWESYKRNICMAIPTDCTSECNGKAGLCDFCNPGDGRQGACCKKGETDETGTDPGGDNVCNHQESSGMVFPFADNMRQSATLWKYECVVVPEPAAVECVWGDWSATGDCSETCSGSSGTQTYTRSKEPASEACAETETESRACVGISACESCVASWNVTEEVLVSQCEGKGETLTRKYEVSEGAAECPHVSGETQSILCPTDCTGSWEVQGACTGAGETLTEMFNRVEAEPGMHINGTEIAASSCDLPINGTTQDSSTACPLHTCTCEHGEAETGSDCIEDGVTVGCVVGGCNNDVAGYYHNDGGEAGNNCVANSCKCDHGTELVSALLCEQNDETVGCVDGGCLDGYFNVDIGNGDGRFDCQLKECTCEFGESAIGSECPENGAMQCRDNECDSGYRNNPTDVRKECVPNTCACANGEPLVDAVCESHENTIGCSETGCHEGYHHEEIDGGDGRGTCVENQCTCENGFPLTDPAVCTEHQSTPGCASCKESEGFKLHAEDHSCVRDCEGSWNVTNGDFVAMQLCSAVAGNGEVITRVYSVVRSAIGAAAEACEAGDGTQETITCPTDCQGFWNDTELLPETVCTGAGETLSRTFTRTEAVNGRDENNSEIVAGTCTLPAAGAIEKITCPTNCTGFWDVVELEQECTGAGETFSRTFT